MAQATVHEEERRHGGSLPAGVRMVVVVTDAAGDYVGVGANTTFQDAWGILNCAVKAEGRVDHSEDQHGTKAT